MTKTDYGALQQSKIAQKTLNSMFNKIDNMVKIKHNIFLVTVNDVFIDAIDEGVLHLYKEGETFTRRTISFKDKKLNVVSDEKKPLFLDIRQLHPKTYGFIRM